MVSTVVVIDAIDAVVAWTRSTVVEKALSVGLTRNNKYFAHSYSLEFGGTDDVAVGNSPDL